MNSHAWQQPVSSGDAYRRAGGRRRVNASRKLKAELRRFKVVPLLRSGHTTCEMAEALGVSPSTIRRDLNALLAQGTIAVVQPSHDTGERRGGAFPLNHWGNPRKRPV